jgi:hypothetical protein
VIPVRLQKVVEELHVELVVFHDQDGLRHPSPTYEIMRRRRPSPLVATAP